MREARGSRHRTGWTLSSNATDAWALAPRVLHPPGRRAMHQWARRLTSPTEGNVVPFHYTTKPSFLKKKNETITLPGDCPIRRSRSLKTGYLGHQCEKDKLFTSIEFVHEHKNSNTDAYRIVRSSIHAELRRHVWFLNSPDDVCNMYNPPN